jgi:hypothetical protein
MNPFSVALRPPTRAIGFGALLAGLLLACGDRVTGPVLTASDLEGQWALVLHEDAPGCVPERGAVQVLLTVEHVLTDVQSGDLYLTGRWDPEPVDGWSVAQGRFAARDGTFELTLWGASVGTGGPRIAIHGDYDARPGLDGQWAEVGGDVLYEGGCSGHVTGERLP